MRKVKSLSMSLLSFVLIIAMMFSITTPVLAQTIAVESTEYSSSHAATLDEVSVEQSNIIGEDISKRDEYTKYFITDAGTTIAAQYGVPVHYKDENGEYVDFDNSLFSSQASNSEATEDEVTEDEVSAYSLRTVEETEDTFTNKKSNSKVSHFKKSGKAKLVEITKDNHTISWGYSGANTVDAKQQKKDKAEELTGNDAFTTLTNLSSTVLYENIYNNIDLEVINSTVGVKENLILKDSNTKNVFNIEYSIGDLTAESTDNQTIVLKDAEGTVLYTISAPYMADAKGEKSEAVELKILKNNKGKLSVKLTADKIWLKDKSREYPVTVDPDFTYSSITNDIMSWTYIESYNSSTAHGHEQYMYAGTYIDDEDQRTLIKINRLPSLNIGDMIVEAKANLCLIPEGLFTTTYVGAYEITKSWNEYSETWSSFGSGGYDDNLIDYEKFVSGQEAQWVDWDITELVKKWSNKSDPNDNYGYMLKVVDGTAVNQNIRFASPIFAFDSSYAQLKNLRPSFTITYCNNKGLEDYWTYTPVSAGSAGTAYINDYSGNLVFQFGMANTSGLKLPTSIGLTYNSYMADSTYRSSGTHAGYGWKMNLQQTVIVSGELAQTGTVSSSYPYVYTDGDGTDHYFYKKTDSKTNTTEYIDEDGLGFELDVSGNEYIITDKNKGTQHFNKQTNLLTKIKNSTGQEVTLNYIENTSYIDKITDANGKILNIDYGDHGYVDTITDPAERITRIGYDATEGYLTSVVYPDNTTVRFTYTSDGLLSSVTDIDGVKLLFEYSTAGAKGVTSVQEVAADGTLGQKITFDRTKYNTTKMQTAGVDCVFGNSDDITTIYQFDNVGRTISVQSKNSQGEDLGASANTYTSGAVNSTGSNIKQINKLSGNYSLGANRENILKDHSFESLTNWTSASWGTGTVDFTATMNNVSEKVLYGEKSLKLSVNSVSEDARGRVRQDVPIDYLTPGATYTLSAYVRVEDLQPIEGAENYGAVICVTPWDNDGSTSDIYSDYISRNTDTSINKGFRRISVTFQMPQNSTITGLRIQLALRGATGTAYFDAVQLEKSDAPSTYNMLENASFERFSTTTSFDNWSRLQMTSADCKSDASVDGKRSFRITGDVANWKNLYQIVYLGSDAKEEDTYTLSGWATANSVPIGSNEASFRLLARVYYTDNTYKDVGDVPFNDALQNVNWQYASSGFTLSDGKDSTNKTPYYLKIYLGYSYQGNKAYFDNLQLTKEPVPSYTYDKDGNLISVVENAQQKSEYAYKNSNLTYYQDPKGYDYEFTYDDDTNLMKTATTQLGATYSYQYDDYGNATSMEGEAPPVDETSGGKLYLKSETKFNYSDAGASTYSVETYDQDNRKVTSVYDANTGTLMRTIVDGDGGTTSDDITTEYEYDEDSNLLVEVSNDDQSVRYTYDDFHKLTGITHGETSYSFEYDKFANQTKSKVGNRTLMTYDYADNNGYLQEVAYGNGFTKSYTYDRFGNAAEIKYGDVVVARNFADSSGAIIRTQDLLTNYEHRISYDSTGRLISKELLDLSVTGNVDKWLHSLEYNYDANNNVTHFAFADRNRSYVTEYEYGKDNLLTKTTLDNGKTVTNTYDNLGRLIAKKLNTSNAVNISYTYHESERQTVTENGVIKSYTTNNLATEETPTTGYSYVYDEFGNITEVYEKVKVTNEDGSTSYVFDYNSNPAYRYYYDKYNQLIKVKDGNAGIYTEYTYDESGNIISKTTRGWDRESGSYIGSPTIINYSYDDTNGWGDLLTSYNGQAIIYDEIGNPETYRDGINLTWQNGRQLASFTQTGVASVNYAYDADGMRTGKTLTSGTTTDTVEYVYEGGLLRQMRYNHMYFDFSYDANGAPVSMAYRSTAAGSPMYYYYGLNSRGDVVALYNSTGTLTAKYSYDAYGKLLGITNASGSAITAKYAPATLNPLRYRGYIYDNETGFYYVSSRYYDPETCRWINADKEISGVGGEILGYNVFSYCFNNPINMGDPTGNWPKWATIALGVAVAVAAVAVTVVSLGSAAPAAACSLTLMATYLGASYAVANTVATVAVAATVATAAVYAGDIAYSAVTGRSPLKEYVFKGNETAYNVGLTVASVATIGLLNLAATGPGNCFVAGTPVLSECGYIAIEEIKSGDLVWAENPETGEKELKEVVRTFVNETTELIYVHVDSEEIVTTPEHPFYSPVKGWTPACKLRAGDILVMQNGEYVTVEKAQHVILESPLTVYNFEVAEFHTYYVGKCEILVHNTCGGSPSRGVGGKGWVGDKTWRENVSTVGNGGTITSLNGGVPTKAEAMQLINQSGGTALRVESGHEFPNPHNFYHINYTTSTGTKGTIKILE